MKTSDIPTLEVLISCNLFHGGITNEAPWQRLMRKFNAPENVVYSAMERDYNSGYLEYGITLRNAWLTDKGREYLMDYIAGE